ncbi:MAG: beta-ketoacyl-[acyl-carrier-protein] synthase family protein [Victivallaceae bacterium]|nr:beta-ketoacyl-[acyl-carrier-protein] synthase family protein [Victivallaceae bacterium]
MRERIVITGIGLTAPNGNDLQEFRHNLMHGISGIAHHDIRYIGKAPAGMCNFDATKYQNRRDIRNGTRAGSISIYCSSEALNDAGIDLNSSNPARMGVFIGTTEHGNVETENEIYNVSQFDYDLKYWSHHHNPRTVANNPAGETTINLGITGPHCCIGAACAAGNCGVIYGVQQLLLGEVDLAIAGGVSESTGTFGIFAGFQSQGALATNEDPTKASRPMDVDRNGIVIAEGGAIFILERLSDAQKRGAKIYAEIAGYAMNSDATNPVLPNAERQQECFIKGISHAGITLEDIDIVNTHATGTKMGDEQECLALRNTFANATSVPTFNNTKGFIGHTMGAAGVLELAGNLPAFEDNIVHPCLNLDKLDSACELPGEIATQPLQRDKVEYIANSSFGMLGNNSMLVVKKY